MNKPLLVIIAFAAIAVVGFAQSPGDEELLNALNKGPNREKAINEVIAGSEKKSPLILLAASRGALAGNRLEDAAFLFYAAKLRATFERECFPPKGKGGDNPFLAYAALVEQIGPLVNPAVMREPKTFSKAVSRLKNWVPRAENAYDPGYEFQGRKSEKDALDATKDRREGYVQSLEQLASLLSDRNYFEAFRVVQSFNAPDTTDRPSRTQYDAAVEKMKQIEKQKMLKGIFN